MNTIDHSIASKYETSEIKDKRGNPIKPQYRNILLCVLPKDKLSDRSVKQIPITQYKNEQVFVSSPHLIKISDDKLMVLWQESLTMDLDDFGVLKYAFLDKGGNILGEIQALEGGILSKCKPIVVDDNVVWYTNNVRIGGTRVIYKIPII